MGRGGAAPSPILLPLTALGGKLSGKGQATSVRPSPFASPTFTICSSDLPHGISLPAAPVAFPWGRSCLGLGKVSFPPGHLPHNYGPPQPWEPFSPGKVSLHSLDLPLLPLRPSPFAPPTFPTESPSQRLPWPFSWGRSHLVLGKVPFPPEAPSSPLWPSTALGTILSGEGPASFVRPSPFASPTFPTKSPSQHLQWPFFWGRSRIGLGKVSFPTGGPSSSLLPLTALGTILSGGGPASFVRPSPFASPTFPTESPSQQLQWPFFWGRSRIGLGKVSFPTGGPSSSLLPLTALGTILSGEGRASFVRPSPFASPTFPIQNCCLVARLSLLVATLSFIHKAGLQNRQKQATFLSAILRKTLAGCSGRPFFKISVAIRNKTDNQYYLAVGFSHTSIQPLLII